MSETSPATAGDILAPFYESVAAFARRGESCAKNADEKRLWSELRTQAEQNAHRDRGFSQLELPREMADTAARLEKQRLPDYLSALGRPVRPDRVISEAACAYAQSVQLEGVLAQMLIGPRLRTALQAWYATYALTLLQALPPRVAKASGADIGRLKQCFAALHGNTASEAMHDDIHAQLMLLGTYCLAQRKAPVSHTGKDVIAIFTQATHEWSFEWVGVVRCKLAVKPNNKALSVLFDALRTAEWDGVKKRGRVDLLALAKQYWPKHHEHIDQLRDEAKERTPNGRLSPEAEQRLQLTISQGPRDRILDAARKAVSRAVDLLLKDCPPAAHSRLRQLVEQDGDDLWTIVQPDTVFVDKS